MKGITHISTEIAYESTHKASHISNYFTFQIRKEDIIYYFVLMKAIYQMMNESCHTYGSMKYPMMLQWELYSYGCSPFPHVLSVIVMALLAWLHQSEDMKKIEK